MSVLEVAIGWLAPPDCVSCGLEGEALCRDCSATKIVPFGERCWNCNKLSPGGLTCATCYHPGSPRHIWINTSYESYAQALVQIYKFGHLRAAAEPLSKLMVQNFYNINQPDSDYLVIPLPTATSRIRQRGFGHSELLARKVALKLRLDQKNSLRRLDQTRQLGAKRPDRLTQLANSFAVKYPADVRDRKILLIDDVLTTGGSLIAASNVLKAAGAKRVDALVFAKRL